MPTRRKNKTISQSIILAVLPLDSDAVPADDPENAIVPAKATKLPPDPEEMNERRTVAAERALLSFAAAFGELIEGEDLTTQNLVDLLANIGHLCDRKELYLPDLLRKAGGHYLEETDNEGTQFDAWS